LIQHEEGRSLQKPRGRIRRPSDDFCGAPAAAELKPGDPAPDFETSATIGGQPFRFVLADALKKGPVVLYFYPKAFTQGCTIEARNFAEAHDEYAALGATVIGVSGDDIETLNRFSVSECRSRFAVASDPKGRIMKSYDASMPFVETFAKRVSVRDLPAASGLLRLVVHESRAARAEHTGSVAPLVHAARQTLRRLTWPKASSGSNKETRKPKKDASPPKPISTGAITPTKVTVVPERGKKAKLGK
jgi:peroxiredoxin